MELFPLPAFSDNYIWTLHNGQRALVVDPGESDGVLAWLDQRDLQLDTILITHHHADHTGGVAALREATGARVVGPAFEPMPEPLQRVSAGEHVDVLGLRFEVIEVPGHTAGHIAFYAAEAEGTPLLFCGDTLFSGGCGRLFEGTPAQMLDSLTRLAALPAATRVCCTHEYTLSNLKFAQAIEPDNSDLAAYTQHCQQQRSLNFPTLPSSIGLEKRINPFLRTAEATVVQSARNHEPATTTDAVSVFATLRTWKNNFK
ncbi:hydroxyacylglutathione hydrolase [Hydrogenophaga sp.]|jgi:hydroxyacylglutathione hydrolase|uniref:hydroxyacylglutathione hydrolase n=1 Tax=Hydrogenophaga sp. TaxID=1904254 RepID=UPI0025B86D91|nr:hydroxyacylglutathione hydrolase [Hydrogenophaga sp.]MDO8889992.1 hydroxyacylglutathione hydrolase [Hydrogenophaga sp.]MDO9135831.1 hydroxyacylglutathione hydrolase [Hydrogenophaga sp.]MDP2985975.1 hydroxyacylglutathione hydrolase [Hydrogenophaga sp.]